MIDFLYKQLIQSILRYGEIKEGRNGKTLSSFGETLQYDIDRTGLPLLSLRKIYTKGVVGEFKTFVEGKTDNIKYFEKNGCKYWKLWAKEDGSINIDYAPGKQLDDLIENIKKNPQSRRHIINLWNHDNLPNLSLPCCHYTYQFYVRQNKYIDMIWTQRSVDVAVGLPSDLILSALYVIYVAMKTDYLPGKVRMNFGDAHIYEEHIEGLKEMLERKHNHKEIKYIFNPDTMKLKIFDYEPHKPIKFLLKD